MDKKVEILLGSEKNIISVNTDSYDKVELNNKTSELTEFNVNDVVNSTEQFNIERENNPIYRIYGRIEYLSLLNGLVNNYTQLDDYFTPNYTDTSKNILNSFDFYLVKPSVSGYTEFIGTNEYVRHFQVIATPDEFELYPAGFSNNVYGEQTYTFSFNEDFDISEYFDNFGFPVTELFLYAQYKLKANGNYVAETMKYSFFINGGAISKSNFPTTTFNIGDYISTATGSRIGDKINYNKEEFTQTQIAEQKFYITTEYWTSNNQSKNLVWVYNPFIPFRLRYFSEELNNTNTGSTSYDIANSIPDYATKLDDDGNYVWRDINPQGYTEPLTGVGVDYPFFNGKRYLFSPIILSVLPDLTDSNTLAVFNEIWYTRYTTNLDITPTDDLDNIGKPCQ